jgi:hypothetical protein
MSDGGTIEEASVEAPYERIIAQSLLMQRQADFDGLRAEAKFIK